MRTNCQCMTIISVNSRATYRRSKLPEQENPICRARLRYAAATLVSSQDTCKEPTKNMQSSECLVTTHGLFYFIWGVQGCEISEFIHFLLPRVTNKRYVKQPFVNLFTVYNVKTN